jgi:hypothetical protein
MKEEADKLRHRAESLVFDMFIDDIFVYELVLQRRAT